MVYDFILKNKTTGSLTKLENTSIQRVRDVLVNFEAKEEANINTTKADGRGAKRNRKIRKD